MLSKEMMTMLNNTDSQLLEQIVDLLENQNFLLEQLITFQRDNSMYNSEMNVRIQNPNEVANAIASRVVKW